MSKTRSAQLAPAHARADLHQVQGTLRMVELYGAAMVAERWSASPMRSWPTPCVSATKPIPCLMRGMVQLPDYLERLQSGAKDIPIVLLPLLNDLPRCWAKTCSANPRIHAGSCRRAA
jgi:hypothetical protein